MDQIQNPDTTLGLVDNRSQIRSAIDAVLPELTQVLSRFPSGFQYDVNAPKITLESAEEYAQVMGRNLDPTGKRILATLGGELSVEPRLGVLNVVRNLEGELEMEFRSQTGGRTFTIKIMGDALSINGDATEEEVMEALSMLFKEGKVNRDQNAIHITTTRNLAIFDRDGNPIKK